MSWLRLYTDVLHDPKVQRLPAELFKSWINCLCLAKEGGGLLPPIEDVAFGLRTSTVEAQRLTEELVKRGLLDTDGKNLTPHNWGKRQYENEGSTERVRRHRAGNDEPHKSGKANYVYFIGTTINQIVKIGISKNPWARLTDLQTDSSEQLYVLATFRADTYSEVAIHHLLDEFRRYGEWFELPESVQTIVLDAATNKDNYDALLQQLRVVVGEQCDVATTYRAEQSRNRAETEQSRGGSGENPSPASRAKPRSARRPVLPDEEWLDEKQRNPAYSMLDVRHVYHKMLAWCEVNGKQPNRRRLINWLNTESKPMTAKSAPPKKPGNSTVGANSQYTLEEATQLEQTFDWDAWITQCIDSGWIPQLKNERRIIAERGGPVEPWELRVYEYLNAAENAAQ